MNTDKPVQDLRRRLDAITPGSLREQVRTLLDTLASKDAALAEIRAELERTEATCTAWQEVYEGIARVIESSKKIVAARWASAARERAATERAESELALVKKALKEAEQRYNAFRALWIETMDKSPACESAEGFLSRLTDAMEKAADKFDASRALSQDGEERS